MRKENALKIIGRIVLDLSLALAVFFLPIWSTLLLALAGLLLFEDFFEFVVVFFLIDLIYSPSDGAILNFKYSISLISLVIFLINFFVRRNLLISK